MSRSLHSEVVQEHCLAGLDVIALAGEEVYSRLGLPSQGIDPSTVSRIETAAMSKEEGLAPRRTHAPHSERAGVTEVVEEDTKPRRRRAAVMPAQMLALGLHTEIGGLLRQRRRIADDVGV